MSAEKLIIDMTELVNKIKQLAELDPDAALKEYEDTKNLFDGISKECRIYQEPLGKEFEKVLYDNLDKLYEDDE